MLNNPFGGVRTHTARKCPEAWFTAQGMGRYIHSTTMHTAQRSLHLALAVPFLVRMGMRQSAAGQDASQVHTEVPSRCEFSLAEGSAVKL